jgi:two-component system, response regulator FlrC
MNMKHLLWIEQTKPDMEVQQCIKAEGYLLQHAADLTSLLNSCSAQQPDIVALATELPEISMPDLMLLLKKRYPSCQVIVLVDKTQHQLAAQSLNYGAIDYLLKPFNTKQLQNILCNVASMSLGLKELVAVSLGSRQVLQLANRAAQTDATVLLHGESGTGKEKLARYIHNVSPRRDKPYVAVNCAAIPENMLEAMLFGYNKGAFTGAVSQQIGKFESANGGTLVLDEISELPLALQAKLLRVLQERELERLGSNQKIKLDLRIITASNKDLRLLVEQGLFRQDLFYRLDVLPLSWPALRERKDDIIPLAEFFIQKYADGKYLLSKEAKQLLLQYQWPGNVRELENVVQRALVMARGIEVQAIDLNLPMVQATTEVVSANNLKRSKKDAEFDYILGVLTQCKGHRTKAALALGVSTRALRYKLAAMREHGVDIDAVA